MPPWHEDDAFWATWRPAMFGAERWEKAPQEIEHALELLAPPAGARILDLCCGTGRHSLELARRGFRVTAVDRTEEYIHSLREAAAEEGLEVETVLEDMRRFRHPAAFDAAINLFTSFGYFEDQAEDRLVAENLLASLKPGGALLIEMMGKEVLARIFRPRDWTRCDDGSFQLQECEVIDDWRRARNRWIMIRDGEVIERTFEHRLYSAAELTGLLAEVGFGDFEVYGSLAGDPYDHEAKRLVVLARRPR
ncbi:MAG: class I SAM-dependent methyltransferase [Armatimonadota bacterium]